MWWKIAQTLQRKNPNLFIPKWPRKHSNQHLHDLIWCRITSKYPKNKSKTFWHSKVFKTPLRGKNNLSHNLHVPNTCNISPKPRENIFKFFGTQMYLTHSKIDMMHINAFKMEWTYTKRVLKSFNSPRRSSMPIHSSKNSPRRSKCIPKLQDSTKNSKHL